MLDIGPCGVHRAFHQAFCTDDTSFRQHTWRTHNNTEPFAADIRVQIMGGRSGVGAVHNVHAADRVVSGGDTGLYIHLLTALYIGMAKAEPHEGH